MPLIATRGAASAQGFGEFAQSAAANYIEDVFSTYLYTGNASTNQIVNGIDLSTKGGLIWLKDRTGASAHGLMDTARGLGNILSTNDTQGQTNYSDLLNSFNTNGFTLGSDATSGYVWNGNPNPYVSWTFRKQTKFFDIVTYTGTGAARTIAHNLGSVPGCIIVKRTDTAASWAVYHQSLANTEYLLLNSTAGKATGSTYWNSTTPTSTVFSVGTIAAVNASGGTYVAYLFASNAGGFGTAGTDNVISCGSFTTSGTTDPNATVNLGYEPQFVLFKRTNTTSNWYMFDNMRGLLASSGPGSGGPASQVLYSNLTNAEGTSAFIHPTSTGFTMDTGTSGATYIYIAIRRGPMKTPTSATSVFSPGISSANPSVYTTGFPVDLAMNPLRAGSPDAIITADRLRGSTTTQMQYLSTSQTTAESSSGGSFGIGLQSNTTVSSNGLWGAAANAMWAFGRAPSFMDVVCYNGSGSTSAVNHNLGVQPELIIYKARSNAAAWIVHTPSLISQAKFLFLNSTDAAAANSTQGYDNSGTPTATTITPGAYQLNTSGWTYVAYLFASLAGVSKVGTYSGTGATQTISCGFSARFVLIKRTDSTGSWWVWDTARGMVSGTDPRLALNSTAAESNANWVYTNASGFQIVTTDASVNASGGTYIYLAIA